MPDELRTPLNGTWCLLADDGVCGQNQEWLDIVKPCSLLNDIENFWATLNNVVPPSQLTVNSNYHFFRKGIKPMWEDEKNKKGGKWVMTIPRQDRTKGKCDEWWLYTLLAIIGETLDESGRAVCGAVVSIRKNQDKIALWINTTEKEEAIKIGQRWKSALQINKTSIKFQSHTDAIKSDSSFNNKVFYEV